MRILFVVNPVAGAASNDKAVLSIHDTAIAVGADFKFHYTTGEQDDEKIQKQLDDYRPDRVVAGGGDGTLQLVARALLGRDIPMGIISLGSANGFATALELPSKVEEQIDLVFKSTNIRAVDMLYFDDRYHCIHLADIGINARMVKKYTEGDDSGMIGYAKHLLQSIKETPLLRYTVVTPEETYHKEGYMVAIANANKYGTGIHISEGSVSDGKFEICNVETVALDSAIKAGLTKFNVFIDKDMFSDVISCSQAEIKFEQKVDFQIDGEYMGEVDSLKIKILPAAIHLITPMHE